MKIAMINFRYMADDGKLKSLLVSGCITRRKK